MYIDIKYKGCYSIYHNPPMYIYIPPGSYYDHTCPACGKTVWIYGINVSWRLEDNG